METVGLALLLLFGFLNLWVFRRFQKPLFPLLAAILLSLFVYFLSPALGLLVFLIGQTLAFYWAGKR